MEKERDTIIIVKGGTIQGIFSTGVLTAFENHNIYDRIHSIYGVSSGAHNAAYFLARQTKIAAQIYHEHLCKKHRFLKDLSAKVIWDKFWQLMLYKKTCDIIDLDYARELEIMGPTKLDVKSIRTSPINFYVRVFNPETLNLEYLDAKVDTINRLIQSAKIPPYAYTRIKNELYYDGGIMPTRDFIKNVLAKHPDKQILYIFNDKKTLPRVLKFLPWDLLDLLFKTRYLGLAYGIKHFFSLLSYPYIEGLRGYKNVHVVYDEIYISKTEKNVDRVRESYKHGIYKGEKLLKEIGFIN
ncbi:MAG: patatin-like phospholipase family protein [Patescibacteria group bacterium]|jgi:predicted patatin/cPLA2 family phospholipase